MVNIRTKGQTGEREVCKMLNDVLEKCLADFAYKKPEKPVFQRNQNQSAVGGSDITNPFTLCIEVKRQETLQINNWWNQCLVASNQFGGIPILIYRQNGKRKWNIVMEGNVNVGLNKQIGCRVQIEQETFLMWLETYLTEWLKLNEWVL